MQWLRGGGRRGNFTCGGQWEEVKGRANVRGERKGRGNILIWRTRLGKGEKNSSRGGQRYMLKRSNVAGERKGRG